MRAEDPVAVPKAHIEACSTTGARIHVTGNSTSGKSTLSARLGRRWMGRSWRWMQSTGDSDGSASTRRIPTGWSAGFAK